MPFSLEQLERAAASTLPKFLDRPGEKFALVNEVARQTYVAGQLLKRIRTSIEGGLTLKWRLQFAGTNSTQWAHPYSEVALANTRPPVTAQAPWRMAMFGWYIPAAELDSNRGIKEVLVDLGRQAREDVSIDLANTLEDALLAPDGNYLHGGDGPDNLLPYGLLYAATLDGLNVSGTGNVFGIDPAAQPLHRNGFISPVASSDGLGTMSSIYDLRPCLNRAMRAMRFDDIVQAWGDWMPGEGVQKKQTPADDPDGPEKPGDLMILCDDRSEVAYREIMFGRQDDIGYDQNQPRPAYKRLKLLGSDKLRMSSFGYGFDDAGLPLWADRTGNYASGQWPSWGRTVVVNTRYYHAGVHPMHSPNVKKAYVPERRFGIAVEGDLWLQTCCRSRRRGLFHIGPYDTALPNS